MALRDRATNLFGWLESSGIGDKPLFFITHSLGGLVVKKMLQYAETYALPMLSNIKAVVFLSTPHIGAGVADLFARTGFLGRPTVTIDELRAHDPDLYEVNNWYRQRVLALGLATKAYYETQPTNGLLVVDRVSADPGVHGILPIAVLADHLSIARPISKEDLVYKATYQLIQRSLLATKEPIRTSHSTSAMDIRDVALLALAERTKADLAVGKTDSILDYVELAERIERGRQGWTP